MPTFSAAFNLGITQPELDFVDVSLGTDNRLFVDPFALSQRADRWSQDAHHTVAAFFQQLIDDIRADNPQRARRLLLNLREPNETRLGYSAHRPQGAGIGIGHDKISDLTTNLLRAHLADYTVAQCNLHGVPIRGVAMPPCFNTDSMEWEARYLELPIYRDTPILLVPKPIIRRGPAYESHRYYQHFVLNYLQQEELNNPASQLVRTLKDERRVVYKKDLAARHPLAKEFLYEFSRQHPEVLANFREWLAAEESRRTASDVDEEDESVIADALAQALRNVAGGNERASEYHKLMIGTVEFLFFPHLLHPRKEQEIHQGRKRIDILVENGARDGIFHRIPTIRGLPCAYVPFECKNYTTEVANPELDQLAGRFSVNRGQMGFLCCRNFEDRALFIERCRDTFRDGRGLIIPLDDPTILRMLESVSNRRREELDDVLSALVAEIWAQ